MTFRASSMPLAFACPGSVHAEPGELLIEETTEGASLGSAVHEVLSEMIVEGELPDARPSALKWACDVDELGRLSHYGAQAWREVRHAFPNPLTEQELVAGELTGHIDVLSLRLQEKQANILDFKSGFKRSDFYAQVMSYATLVCENFPDVQTLYLTIVWLRDHETETFRATREAVEEWNGEMQRRVFEWDGRSYAAGTHCQFCPRFAACPARQALVRSAVQEAGDEEFLRALDIQDLAAVMPAIITLYRTGRLALVKQVLGRIDTLIHQDIQVNGTLDLGNGRELYLAPEPRDTIDAMLGWPVVTKYLTQEQLAPAVKIGKTALLDAVRATVAKGKGKLADQVRAELKAADAVRTQTIYKLRERQKAEVKETVTI